MSSKGKKSGKKNTNKALGDVTLDDFANAKVRKNRSKKASVDSVTRLINQMKVDDRSWDEKISDFDGDFDFIEEENEDGTTSMVIKRSESKRKRRTISETDISERPGLDYPIDIWFLISEYVRPEDVGRFAGICRNTYAVVYSAKFWFSLYKRYYKTVPDLPERLQPECMVRLYGLRACVIRALHYMYPPYIERMKSVTSFEEHPFILLKRQCVLMWHKKCKNVWLYYFKLKEHANMSMSRSHRDESRSRQPDLTEMLEDVSANNEDGCRILQVSCMHFISVPIVLGLTLSSVLLTLSQGFRHQRLQMGFGSGLVYSSKSIDVSNMTEIVLDPVINVRVLDWWHPLYPHSQTTPLLNQD